MKSLLTERQQFVEYGGYISSAFYVKSGVAQGSNLGPLLFIVFFNDVVKYLRCCKFIFADDLKVGNIIRTHADCLELQDDVDSLNAWCKKNKLDLNISKCRIMSFSRKIDSIHFYYNVHGNLLERCDQFRDLGVIMDSTLSFVPHIESITNSALRTLGFIVRNTNEVFNIDCLKLLFYTLVRSKLEYCCVIWSPHHQVYVNLIENVLRKFCMFAYFKIFGIYPPRHSEQHALLTIVKECSLKSRRDLAHLVFLQKIIHGQISSVPLLSHIKLYVPRIVSRIPLVFYYYVPKTFHHYHCPLLTCFRLCNCLSTQFDIFNDNLAKKTNKCKILELCA